MLCWKLKTLILAQVVIWHATEVTGALQGSLRADLMAGLEHKRAGTLTLTLRRITHLMISLVCVCVEQDGGSHNTLPAPQQRLEKDKEEAGMILLCPSS